MSPPRTPTRDRSPQRIITEIAAVSNSVQPSPVGPRRSSSEGLSRRSSWNRPVATSVPDPLNFNTSTSFGRTDPDIPHFDTQSIVDDPEIDPDLYYSHHLTHSEASLDSPTNYPADVDDSTRLTSAAAPPWRGDPHTGQQSEEEDHSAAWGTAGPSTPRRSGAVSPMRSATLKAVSKHIRRVSLRVVNLAGVQLEDKPVPVAAPRTPDVEDPRLDTPTQDNVEPVVGLGNGTAAEDELDRSKHMTLRGRTLGVFGPDNGFRQAMRAVLLWT